MHANPAFSRTSRWSGDIPSAYFAADLTNGPAGNTGAQAWISDGRVPEPATLGLTGAGLLTLRAGSFAGATRATGGLGSRGRLRSADYATIRP